MQQCGFTSLCFGYLYAILYLRVSFLSLLVFVTASRRHGAKGSDGGFGSRRFDITFGRGFVPVPSQQTVWITGSPADRHEIHAATRLRHEGITPRIKREIIACPCKGRSYHLD